jgi:L-asparagine oxygenase
MTNNVAVDLQERPQLDTAADPLSQLYASEPAGPEWSVRLDETDREAIAGVAAQLRLDSVPGIDHDVILAAQCAAGRLPAGLIRRLHTFRKWSNAYGTLLIQGLPVDPNPPATPLSEEPTPVSDLPVASAVQLLVMCLLGEPIAYRDEKNGEMIQSVHPVAGREERQENTGSVFLEFHTEDGFHPFRPDFLSLVCIRQDHDKMARTASASIRRALPHLPHAVIDLLRRPEYRTKLASSFGEQTRYAAAQPVLSGDFAVPEICVDMHATQPLTDSAAWAFGHLRKVLESVAIDAALSPGDLLIVDNRTALHARTGFVPRYDGQDRWLRRMFAVTDLRRSQPARAGRSHVCVPLSVLDVVEGESA